MAPIHQRFISPPRREKRKKTSPYIMDINARLINRVWSRWSTGVCVTTLIYYSDMINI